MIGEPSLDRRDDLRTELGGADHFVDRNADSNTWVNAVNDQLGFVPAERMGDFQKRIG